MSKCFLNLADNKLIKVESFDFTDSSIEAIISNKRVKCDYLIFKNLLHLKIEGQHKYLQFEKNLSSSKNNHEPDKNVKAEMPGTVISILSKAGMKVEVGQILMIVESMKIQTNIISEVNGTIDKIYFSENQSFERGTTFNFNFRGVIMSILKTSINTSSNEFNTNYIFNKKLVEIFRKKQEESRLKRSDKDITRVRSQGKLLPRERINLLLDQGSPFLELSSLAACNAYNGEAPSASCITGIGSIHGKDVLIIANDPTVKGGAWYPLTVKKIVRALDIAIENQLPVVHLCDSAGGFLPQQANLFADKEHAGRMFRNQCVLSKLGVKQLAIVFGHCTAGGAYIPALSDYSIMVRGNGAIFLAGPPLVKAATGENVSAEELGGADLHSQISGTCDYSADSEEQAIELGREVVEYWSENKISIYPRENVSEPYYSPTELYGIIPNDIKKAYDSREVIARIVDASNFHEFQPQYGKTLICGYAYIWGFRVGILANNGVIFNESALKGAHFIQLCDKNKTLYSSFKISLASWLVKNMSGAVLQRTELNS